MSLPTAPRDISDKPRAGAVTDPVNKTQKDADVDRKLRLYGVIEAFRQGRMPNNAQIDQTLKYVRDNSFVDIKQLSPDGQKLISDVRDIIETSRVMVKEKNADELFQNFIWHTRGTDASRAKQDPNDLLPVSADKAKSDGQEAVQHLRTLLSLVLTNSEARKLLSDFSLIGRDLLAKSAAKTAEMIGPDQERLNQVDQTGPDSQFVSAGGRQVGMHETPVPEINVPGTDYRVQQHPREPLGHGANVVNDQTGEVTKGHEVADQAQRQKDQAFSTAQDEQFQGQARDQAFGHAQDVQGNVQNAPPGEKASTAKGGIMGKMQDLRDGVLNRVPQEHKDKAGDHLDRAKTFLSDEYFPPERRDQFIFRGKKVIVECQKHDDYQSSMRWLLDFFDTYAQHARNAGSNAGDSHKELSNDRSLNVALSELRELLERFANGQSMQPTFDAIDQLITDTKNDEELRNWFSSVDAYVRRTLLEPGYVLQPDCNNEANRLRESGRGFYDGKYKSHFDNLFDTISNFFAAMSNDPLNDRFGKDWARLTRDLLFDSEGSLKFKPELWGDIRKVILPEVIDRVGYIPIPRIEYTDDSLDLIIENLTLSGRNLFPNLVSLEAHNFVKFSPYNNITDESHHDFTLHFGQIQADMRDVAFYFRKKTGFPKITDSGLADVVLGGEGLSATVHLASAGKDQSSVFKVKNVSVKVDSLKFSIRDSKHDTLYNTLRPLATGLVKKQIQKAFQDALTTGLEYVDGQLVGVRNRMNEAKASDESSRSQVLKDLFQSKSSDVGSVKSKGDQHFKVVAKRDSVLIPGQGHPDGWVNRQQDRQDAAMKGEGWKSEAFTIV